MQLNIVEATVKSATKGANIILAWTRECKVKKSCSDVVSKSVRAVGRMGIDYDNMAIVKEKRENGELPAESAGLPWGTWYAFPYLIEHKGNYYLRLYKGTGTAKAHTTYYRNGIETSFDNVENDLLSSEKGKKTGDCFNVKIADMTLINWEPATPSINRDSIKSTNEVEETTEETTEVPF